MQHLVREFHEAFGHPAPFEPTPHEVRRALRCNLVFEELNELAEALGCFLNYGEGYIERKSGIVDMVAAADAIGDLLYVVLGTAVELGIVAEPVVREIHRSNMSKLGADGKPIYRADGKTLKGPSYSPPELDAVLADQGWRIP